MYLFRDRNGTYYCRHPLPRHISQKAGYPTDFKVSLRTKDRCEAIDRFFATGLKIRTLIRAGATAFAPDELRALLATAVQADCGATIRLRENVGERVSTPSEAEPATKQKRKTPSSRAKKPSKPVPVDRKPAPLAITLPEPYPLAVELPKQAPELPKAAVEMSKVAEQLPVLATTLSKAATTLPPPVTLARVQGQTRLARKIDPKRAKEPQPASPIHTPEGLQALHRQFIDSKKAEAINQRSVDALDTRIGHFIRSVGVNTPVASITTAVAMTYRNQLLTCGKSYKTCKEYFAALRQFFAWCCLVGVIARNPFQGVTAGRRPVRGSDEERMRWERTDLNTLFQSSLFTAQNQHLPDDYWIPLVLLFSGMRAGECCQLRCDDVVEVEGVLCFRIDKLGPGQRLKTSAARRLVPVHSRLRELGFEAFLQWRRSTGHTQLFECIPTGVYDEWAKNFLQRFNRHLTTLGYQPGARPSAHGLRHTFVDELQRAGVAENVVAEIIGHAKSNITFGRYGKRLPPAQLQEGVEAFVLNIEIPAWNSANHGATHSPASNPTSKESSGSNQKPKKGVTHA